jgi:hypothetical protein
MASLVAGSLASFSWVVSLLAGSLVARARRRRIRGRPGGGGILRVAVSWEGVSNVMLRRTFNGAVLSCGFLFLAGVPALADDDQGNKPALSGAWGKKEGQLKIQFADKGVMKIFPHGDDTCAILFSYTVEKGGLVKVKVTGFEGTEEVQKKIAEHAPLGLKFSFKWTVKGDAATLNDVKGDKAETLKSHLEGDFEEKK